MVPNYLRLQGLQVNKYLVVSFFFISLQLDSFGEFPLPTISSLPGRELRWRRRVRHLLVGVKKRICGCAPEWLDIDGDCSYQEVTSVQVFFNKGVLQRNRAILLAIKVLDRCQYSRHKHLSQISELTRYKFPHSCPRRRFGVKV